MEVSKTISPLAHINESNFENIALRVFESQYKSNLLYRNFADRLGKVPGAVHTLKDLPFLPIRFFKSHRVVSGTWTPATIFTSSATTGMSVSQHLVASLESYLANAVSIFEQFYGPVEDYHFLALLPSYVERNGSSLIAMIDHFISRDQSGESGYYLNNYDQLFEKIKALKYSRKKIMLWGVSFALLDMAERYDVDLGQCIVIETGGMKGRRKEWVRAELHSYLKMRFHVSKIHSEYGMTELFSQAYSAEEGYFNTPSWMKIIIRDINDPFEFVAPNRAGGVNIIDLANSQTCAFIETEDLGRIREDASFEILGRADNSDVRGCNLLVG